MKSVHGVKINCSSIIYAAKKNDYERVKILLRYGYRLQRFVCRGNMCLYIIFRCDTITDPLKKIELFKALASPAFIGRMLVYGKLK